MILEDGAGIVETFAFWAGELAAKEYVGANLWAGEDETEDVVAGTLDLTGDGTVEGVTAGGSTREVRTGEVGSEAAGALRIGDSDKGAIPANSLVAGGSGAVSILQQVVVVAAEQAPEIDLAVVEADQFAKMEAEQEVAEDGKEGAQGLGLEQGHLLDKLLMPNGLREDLGWVGLLPYG